MSAVIRRVNFKSR